MTGFFCEKLVSLESRKRGEEKTFFFHQESKWNGVGLERSFPTTEKKIDDWGQINICQECSLCTNCDPSVIRFQRCEAVAFTLHVQRLTSQEKVRLGNEMSRNALAFEPTCGANSDCSRKDDTGVCCRVITVSCVFFLHLTRQLISSLCVNP